MSEKIDKLDVLRAQLNSAIVLVSLEDGYISAHTVIMAAEELFRTWYEKKNLFVEFDYRIYIKDEHQREYLQKTREKYNFFKHADRDIDDVLEIDREQIHYLNEILLALLIYGYRKSFTHSSLAMDTYNQWVAAAHPNLIKWQNIPNGNQIKANIEKAGFDADKSVGRKILRVMLYKEGVLPRDDFE